MRLRHLIAIFTFLAAFGLSVFFVAAIVPKNFPNQASSATPPTIARAEIEAQIRIDNFFEPDRQVGLITKGKVRLNDYNNRIHSEKLVTAYIIKEIRGVDCPELPSDFCEAWQEHAGAWNKKREFLRENSRGSSKNYEQNYSALNDETERTYIKMLDIARNYNVNIKY